MLSQLSWMRLVQGADIQVVVLPPLVSFVVLIQAYPALVGGRSDVVIVFGRGAAGHSLNQKQGAAVRREVMVMWVIASRLLSGDH